jgi:hypothetical protein
LSPLPIPFFVVVERSDASSHEQIEQMQLMNRIKEPKMQRRIDVA